MACRRSGVRIPLSSTGFPDLCSVVKDQAKNLSVLGFLVALVGIVAERVVHHGRSPATYWDDHVPVDGLGDDVGGLVADGVADVLDGYAVAAHDRDSGVATLVDMPVAGACISGHLGEAPVERVGRVGRAVLVAEHEVGGVPGVAGFAAFAVLPDLVRLERDDGALRDGQRALRLGSWCRQSCWLSARRGPLPCSGPCGPR